MAKKPRVRDRAKEKANNEAKKKALEEANLGALKEASTDADGKTTPPKDVLVVAHGIWKL